MILHARDVVALQFFLMDSAKRYAMPDGRRSHDADELLAGAAALDYPVMVARGGSGESCEPEAATAASLREIVTRAVSAALDFIETMLRAPDDAFVDFCDRHGGPAGIFEVIGALRRDGAIGSDDVGFRAVTLRNDLLERRGEGA